MGKQFTKWLKGLDMLKEDMETSADLREGLFASARLCKDYKEELQL